MPGILAGTDRGDGLSKGHASTTRNASIFAHDLFRLNYLGRLLRACKLPRSSQVGQSSFPASRRYLVIEQGHEDSHHLRAITDIN
jgi:hypothetical protein